MAFEKFTETARSYRARVSLRSNGTIGLNAGAMAKFNLGKCDYVTLYFDATTHQIGIKPWCKASDEGAHRLNKGKTGAWIAARRFIDYYELGPRKTQRYDASWNETEGMIVIEV